jgi:hypothetical protein
MITTALITTLTIILIIIAVIGGEYGDGGQYDKSPVRPYGTFTKEEFFEMLKGVNKEMNRKEL